MIDGRWEHGSDLHWMEPSSRATYPWNDSRSLFGCSRFALNALLAQVGWRRLWVPSFYCPEVIAAIPRDQLGLEICVYRDTPTANSLSLESLSSVVVGDAILIANTYGLRAKPPLLPAGVSVIEDHTHDFISDWAKNSRADYCITSLRKLLPVPDGGVVWSPRELLLPEEPPLDNQHAMTAFDRLSGSLLKAAYLNGARVDKNSYRSRLIAGEQGLARGQLSGALPFTKSVMQAFPVDVWRGARARNFVTFEHALGEQRGVRLLLPQDDAVPYVATLCFDSQAVRDAVRSQLITARVYPAILWDLDTSIVDIPSEDRELAKRVLSLHCDHRYSYNDMHKVASEVQRALDSL